MQMTELIKSVMKRVLCYKWVLLKNSELNIEECVYIDRWIEKHYKDDFKNEDDAFIRMINDYTLDKLMESDCLGVMDA